MPKVVRDKGRSWATNFKKCYKLARVGIFGLVTDKTTKMLTKVGMRGDFALDIMHDGPRRAIGAVWDGGQAAAREFRVSMSTGGRASYLTRK